MKKTILFSILALGFSNLFAQTQDSVTMGSGSPSYPYDVYYNVSTHQKDSVLNTNWQLAFALRPAVPPNNTMQSATIRVNESRGVTLYKTPFTVSNWHTFTDTAGVSTWPVMHNNNKTWDVGAFNADKDTANMFDYGWGQYDMSSHDVLGTKMYLLAVTNGTTKSYKKITINKIMFDSVWMFTIANLDGTDSATQLIGKGMFGQKLFAYYNVFTKAVIDREPSHPWDMVFTYYRDLATLAPYPPMYFNFMGVLQAPQVAVSRVIGIPKTVSDTANATNYSKNISTIGWDWKMVYLGPPPSGPYDLTDSLTYFIKRDGDVGHIYKFYFTLFNNIPVNNIVFNTQSIETHVGLNTLSASIGSLNVYPNPANTIVNINLTNTKATQVKIQLFDLTGKKVMSVDQALVNKESNTSFNVSELQKGIYFIQVSTDHEQSTRKLIVN